MGEYHLWTASSGRGNSLQLSDQIDFTMTGAETKVHGIFAWGESAIKNSPRPPVRPLSEWGLAMGPEPVLSGGKARVHYMHRGISMPVDVRPVVGSLPSHFQEHVRSLAL